MEIKRVIYLGHLNQLINIEYKHQYRDIVQLQCSISFSGYLPALPVTALGSTSYKAGSE